MNLSVVTGFELNLSCEEARLLGRQDLSDDVETVLRYFLIGFFSLVFPVSVCLTSLTIFLILKFKHLRQTTFLLAMELVLLDLVLSLTFTPLSIVGAINERWILGLQFCRIANVVILFTYQFRGWLMFTFVFDRFWTVFAPFRYPNYRNKVIWSLNISLLVLSSLIDLVVPYFLNCAGFERATYNCFGTVAEVCDNYSSCQLFVNISISWALLFGSFLPMVMYMALFIKARQVRNHLIVPASTPDDSEQRKRNRKVNLTFFTIFLSLVGVILPPAIAFIIITNILVPLGIFPPQSVTVMIYLFQAMFPTLPIADSITILRNPEVRKAATVLKNKLRWRRNRQQDVTTTTTQQELIAGQLEVTTGQEVATSQQEVGH